jgi:hypothetical protein
VRIETNRAMEFADNLGAKRLGIRDCGAEGLDPLPNVSPCQLCHHASRIRPTTSDLPADNTPPRGENFPRKLGWLLPSTVNTIQADASGK